MNSQTTELLASLELPEPPTRYFCNKCGQVGDDQVHHRPHGPKCNYLAVGYKTGYTLDQMLDYARAALEHAQRVAQPVVLSDYRTALDEAARALFAIKRMVPSEVPAFAAEAHRKACAVLDAATPSAGEARDAAHDDLVRLLELAAKEIERAWKVGSTHAYCPDWLVHKQLVEAVAEAKAARAGSAG